MLREEMTMKPYYTAPLAELVPLEAEDVLTLSISLSGNTDGNDDGGDFDSLFG
jgi:hypothetical protein